MANSTPFLVINANEGKTEKILDEILETSKKVLGDFEYELTTKVGDGIEVTKRAKDAGHKTILSVGGDGTLNEILNVVYDSDIKIGIIPSGGSCDASQTNGIPKNLEKAFEVVKAGYTVKAPVAYAYGDTKRYFLDMVNGAFLGYLNEVERTWGKPWLKGDLRYTLLAFESAFKYKPVKTKITVGYQVREIDFSFFALGFGDVLGGYKVLPDNHPQKGELGVVFLKDYKGFRLINSMIKLMFQSIKKNKKAEILYGKKITLESEKNLTWVTEGEIFSREAKKIEFGITPKTVDLIIPEAWKYEASDSEKKSFMKAINKRK
ncbi:MAG: hypothetical protein HZR80_19405 [Candidatus Heimdallarchaeota archaeon]